MPRKPVGPPTFDVVTPARLARASPVCDFCRHWRPGTRTCAAFNAKTAIATIPAAIWVGDDSTASGFRHRQPIAGQGNAVTWQLDPGAEAGARLAGLIE